MLKKLFAQFSSFARSGIGDFDPDFYRRCYSDLRVFRTHSALLRHYLRHGKDEGRFASLAAARAHFVQINGLPPENFSVDLYRQLNPDLAKLYADPIQFELHFLEHGRFENRPHAARQGRPENAWQELFSLYDFRLCNESWLPISEISRAEALALMEREGIDKLAPINREWIFDAAFYRARYARPEMDDPTLYREWLHEGFPASRAPNEIRAVAHLLGGMPYPACFDWHRFCRGKGIKAGEPYPAKINALELFFESPLDRFSRSCVAGEGTALLFEHVGDYHLIRGEHTKAATAFRLACSSDGATARSHLRLGDALKAQGNSDEALSAFRQALGMPDCSIWALIHAVNIMLAMRMFREGMRLVGSEKQRFRAHELFDSFVDEVVTTIYQAVAETMRSMISDDLQDDVLDTYAEGRLGELTAFIRDVKIGPPLALPVVQPRRVVMLACLDLAQCTFYRVEQKKRLLTAAGIAVDIFDFNDPATMMTALPGAASAIFYRVPCYPKIVEAILYAENLGIRTFFDIDDLIFTRDFPDGYESYERQITRQEHIGLCHGVALYRHALSLCTGALVSTQPLAERAGTLVKGGSEGTFVVPNGLDDRSETAVRYGLSTRKPSDSIAIFYGSGTKAHNRDFTALVAPALLDILAEYPRTRLVIVGHLRLDERFATFRERIERLPFITDPSAYWAVLASCDINIAVLAAGPIADCKSEIKWLEAAVLGIPSVMSATRTYEDVVIDGTTGLLARDHGDWYRQLRSLIDDGELRQTIGQRAREAALRSYDAPAVTARLMGALFGPTPATWRPDPSRIRRRRLLICHVFFAPQSHGGATRVVENNIEQLLDRHGGEFEISILSSWRGLKAGALRVDAFRGCAVYRIGTPVEANMDWRPFNDADILPAFRRVLDVVEPDLIHFHCVQRLTASIVEEALRAGVPYFVTVHDAWWISDHQFLVDQNDAVVDITEPFKTLLPAGVSRSESLQRLQHLKGLLNAATATLAVSRSFATLYRQAGIANVKVSENGMGSLPVSQERTTPPDRIVLGHIGGRSVHKGAALVEIALKSHRFRHFELVMIDGTLETGEERHETWGTTPVILRAPVRQDGIGELYGGIDVLLAPSIWPESYGLVVREALFFGCWVVVGDKGALARDVGEGVNGFVIDPTRSETLVSVLSRIDEDVARFKQPPPPIALRRSASQIEELVAEYRAILGAIPVPAGRESEDGTAPTTSGHRYRQAQSSTTSNVVIPPSL